jgi:nucleoside-diphosphate-sugar epimerase
LIAEQMGQDVEFELDQQRVRPAGSEVERLWADNAKINALTGWKPDYAGREGLSRGLKETIAWFSDAANLRRYKAELYNI